MEVNEQISKTEKISELTQEEIKSILNNIMSITNLVNNISTKSNEQNNDISQITKQSSEIESLFKRIGANFEAISQAIEHQVQTLQNMTKDNKE
jgi:methyl-accepting chemotaxis protein